MSKVGRPVGTSGGKAPALTGEEVRRLLAVTAGLENSARNLAFVHVLLCGLRVSEPLAMHVRDVVDSRGTVASSFVLAGVNTKTGKTRRVYLTEQAKKALAAWIAHGQLDVNDRVFPLTANYATTLVKTLMKTAGIVGSSHSLRRTAATQLQEHGVSVRHIQDVLGHSHLNTTQIYLDASPVNVAKAVSTLNW
jgi:integrase/recombinase XerD